ncbi:hypothetical protein HPC49_26495 [Pyxidicoccus fallax]|uniref:Outer membrane protein beta-barrel domain-containing protein n=1 Tax=Pyxidicoccus fallax TaxID=394095 RepID=A0A848LTI0_9BACT|nr:hypothetical protein [Pyxidicoccus fallax]NMO20803.1 hypothetical protein [Pyxidicoccus fallax]NPC81754.1 hypothetical protein [Pyxidicoccus fallax]
MKLLRPCLGGLLALGLFFAPTTSEAAAVRAELGADYWIDQSAAFSFMLGVEGRIVGSLSAGARFGATLITDGNDVGIPLDVYLRANVARSVYIEALAGPWLVFGRGDEFRAHAAFGFGLQGKAASIGIEVGYLEPEPVLGLRLGYKF